MLTGSVMFSFATSLILSTMATAQGIRLNTDFKLGSTREYLDSRDATTDLKRTALNWVGSCWTQGGEAYQERQIFESLPRVLQRSLVKHVAEHIRSTGHYRLPILQGLASATVVAVLVRLKLVEFQKQEYIYKRQMLCTRYEDLLPINKVHTPPDTPIHPHTYTYIKVEHYC